MQDPAKTAPLAGQDPIQFVEQQRAATEKDYERRKRMAEYSVEGKSARELDNILKFGEQAQAKALQSKRVLEAKYGKNFEGDFREIFSAGQYYQENGLPADPSAKNLAQQTIDKISEIQADPAFQAYQDASSALSKASEQYSASLKSEGGAKLRAKQALARQQQAYVDEQGFASLEGVGRWLGRKGAEVTKSIATLPAVIALGSENAPHNPKIAGGKYKPEPKYWAENMISFFDQYVEDVSTVAPEKSSRQGNIFRKEADFEGYKVEVDDAGKMVAIRGANGNIADAPDAEFSKRFADQRVAEKAKDRPILTSFAAIDQVGSKLVDTIADIYIMRATGGGTLGGTAASSFMLQYPQAFSEAQKDLGMSVSDASLYALTVGTITSAVEAHIGQIETAPIMARFKPGLSANTVKTAAGVKINPVTAAWMRMKPALKEIGAENLEEMTAMVAENATKMVFNATTGSKLDAEFDKNEIKETILLTTLATGGVSAPSMLRGGDAIRQQAVLAAVDNPQKFNEIATGLLKNGSITEDQFVDLNEKVARLSVYNQSIGDVPAEARGAALALQFERDELDDISEDEYVLPAVAAQARKEVVDIDKAIAEILPQKVVEMTPEVPEIKDPALSAISDAIGSGQSAEPMVADAIEQLGIFPAPAEVVSSIVASLPSDPTPQDVGKTIAEVVDDAGVLPQNGDVDSGKFDDVMARAVDSVVGSGVPAVRVVEAVHAAATSSADPDKAKAAAERMMETVMEAKGFDKKAVKKVKKASKDLSAMAVIANLERVLQSEPAAQFIEPDPTPDDGPDDIPETEGPDDLTKEDVSETLSFADRLLQSVPREQRDALDTALEVFTSEDGDAFEVGRITAAIRGKGDALDMALVQDLEKNHPAAFAAIKTLIDENHQTTSVVADVEKVGEGRLPESQESKPGQDLGEANREFAAGRAGDEAYLTALEEAPLPESATPEMAEELHKSGRLDLKTAALVAGSRGRKKGAAAMKADGDLIAAQKTAKALSPQDQVAAAAEIAAAIGDNMPKYSQDDTRFYVANVDGARDIMNMLGGKKDGDVWSFPVSAKEKVLTSIRLLQDTNADREDMGASSMALKTKSVLYNKKHTQRLLGRAKTTAERAEIIKKQLGVNVSQRRRLTQKVLKQLQAAFPNVKIVVDIANYEMALSKARPKSGKRPAAFVFAGTVYLDPSRIGPETAIHEVGHVLNSWLKSDQPKIYERQKAMLRGSEYEKAVRNSGDYDNLDEDGILDEAAAMLIGEQGARLVEETTWESAKRILADTAARFLETFGVKITDSLERFGRKQAAMLLKGKQLSDVSSERIAQIEGESRFMFIGQRANLPTDVRDSLIVAKILHDQGWGNAMIHPATNWWMGPDGKWRWEVAGNTSPVQRIIAPGDSITVEDILKNTEMYSMYPAVATYPVVVVEGEIGTKFEGGRIVLSVPGEVSVSDEIAAQMLAAAQRVVQLQEGFATTPDEIGDDYESLMAGAELLFLGQVEQSEAIRRRSMSAEDRRKTPVWADIAPHERIVFFGDDTAFENSPVPGYEVDSTFYGGAPEARYSFTTDNVFEDARNAALKSLLEVELFDPSGKPDEVHTRLALEFEVPVTFIKKLDAEVRHRHAERIKPITFKQKTTAAMMAFLEGKYVWMKRKFHYKSLMPQKLWDAFQHKQNGISGLLERMKQETEAFEKTYASVFDRKDDAINAARRKAIWAVMSGSAAENTIDPVFIPHVRQMRFLVDKLSRDLLYFGAVPKGSVITILENLGIETESEFAPEEIESLSEILAKRPSERTNDEAEVVEDFINNYSDTFGRYLTRTYKVHRAENWEAQIDAVVREKAIAHLTKKYVSELKELREKVVEKRDKAGDRMMDAKQKMANLEAKLTKMLSDATAAIDPVKEKEAREGLDAIQQALLMSDEEVKQLLAGTSTAIAPIANLYGLAMARHRRNLIAATKAATQDFATETKRMLELENLLSQDDKGVRWMIADWASNAVAIGGSRGSGAKDLSILKRREEIDPVIRELMGEDTDPTTSFQMSVWKMANLLESQKMLSFLADNFEGVLFSKEEGRLPDHTVQIAAESSHAFSPLNGMYTSADIAQGIEDFNERFFIDGSHPFKVWIRLVQGIKFGKVILSPAAIMRNFRGNLRFPIMNGWEVVNTTRDLFNARKSDKVRYNAMKVEWAEHGITGKSVTKGDLEATLTAVEQRLPDGVLEATMRPGAKAAKKTLDAFRYAFAAGDTYFRILAFESEKRRYANAWYGKPLDELSDVQKQKVRERAAKLTDALTPNYDYIPKAIRYMRAFPIFGTFISFPTEMFRVSYNTVAVAMDEVRDPRTRAIGWRRIVGIVGTQALVRAAQIWSLMALGVGEDEEEDLRKLTPEYERFDTRIYLPAPDGQVKFYNVSYEDPFNFLDATRAAKTNGLSPSEKAVEMAASMLEPYLSPELSLTTMGRVYFNKRESGGPIWYEGFGGPFSEENWPKTIDYMRQKLQPGVVNFLSDMFLIAAGNEIMPSGKTLTIGQSVLEDVAGIKVRTVDLEQSLFFGLKDSANLKGSIRSALNSSRRIETKIYEIRKANGATKEELDAFDEKARDKIFDIYEEADAQYQEILKGAREKMLAASAFGVAPAKAASVLKDAGFSKDEISAIMAGSSLPLPIGKLDGSRY